MASTKEIFATRLKPQIITKLKEIAEQKDQTPSELARKVLENYVKMH